MKRKGFEKNLMVVLFMLVLVIFSFAQRDSKKLAHYYSTTRLLKTGAAGVTYSNSHLKPAPAVNN